MTTRSLLSGAILLLAAAGLAEAHGGARGGGAARGGARPALPQRGPGISLEARRERTRALEEMRNASSASPPAPTTPDRQPLRERPAPAPVDRSLVHLHHGSVRMAAGLARVDLTLEVQNMGGQVMEWDRTYAIDSDAEVIGAVLKRDGEAPIVARTLTTADALAVYARIRTPPPSRTPRTPNRDPLLVTREQGDELRIRIWPIAPQEIVRVELVFATPLRGEGARRTYVDVMGGHDGDRPVTPREGEAQQPIRTMVDREADWLVHPGDLVLSSAPAQGMSLRGEAGGRLHFRGEAATTHAQPAPRVEFLSKQRSPAALLVGSSSYAGRIASWRFDPRAYLVSKGYVVYDGLTIRLAAKRGSCKRMAPASFEATDEARPVTALMTKRGTDRVSYRVEVVDAQDHVVAAYDEQLPLERGELDAEMEAVVSAWHRAQLVRRVFDAAESDAKRLADAQRFAVDLGVLVPGSAAIAIPAAEKRRLTPTLRRLYELDGVPLGAPRHEADFTAPPVKELR